MEYVISQVGVVTHIINAIREFYFSFTVAIVTINNSFHKNTTVLTCQKQYDHRLSEMPHKSCMY